MLKKLRNMRLISGFLLKQTKMPLALRNISYLYTSINPFRFYVSKNRKDIYTLQMKTQRKAILKDGNNLRKAIINSHRRL